MKTLIDAVIQYLGEADVEEIARLQGALNKQLEHPHFLSLSTSFAKRIKEYYIASEYSTITTIKYIKDVTGMFLKDSKEWFDEFIRPIKPARYLIVCNAKDKPERSYGFVDSLDIADFIVEEMNDNNNEDTWYHIPLTAVDRAELQIIKAEQEHRHILKDSTEDIYYKPSGWIGHSGGGIS